MFNKIKEYYKVKKEFRKDTYKKMLDIILNNVELLAYDEKTKYIYEIPEHVLGETAYDINECSEYLVKRLKSINLRM